MLCLAFNDDIEHTPLLQVALEKLLGFLGMSVPQRVATLGFRARGISN